MPLASPRMMVERLTASRVPATLHAIPKAGHIEAFFDAAALTAAIEFLDKHLHARSQRRTAASDE